MSCELCQIFGLGSVHDRRAQCRSAQITDKADSKVGFLHFQAIIAKKLEVGEGLS